MVVRVVEREEYDVFVESFSNEETYQMKQQITTIESRVFKPIKFDFETIEDTFKHIDETKYPEDYIVQEYYKRK